MRDRVTEETEGKKMSASKLVGFVRKSATGKSLKVNVNKKLFNEAGSYLSGRGEEYVSLFINLDSVLDLIGEQREYAVLAQMVDTEAQESAPAADAPGATGDGKAVETAEANTTE